MEKRCVSCLREHSLAVCPHCGYPGKDNDSHQLPVGTLLRGRYRLGRVLGQGGFGITYMAWDELMQCPVAVKEFFPSGAVFRRSAQSPDVQCVTESAVPHYMATKERFLREAKALVRFRDIPEVVNILDFAEENNTAYIVMEYVRGVDLAGYVRAKGGHLSPEETFRILRPVMEALAKVHKTGIIHRDISPDNILLEPMGGAKLLDFGAVRVVESPDLDRQLTKSTEAILKQGFAPLEQYNTRGSLGPWTDEYAMCATIWYCLTGKLPEPASTRVTEGLDPDWTSISGLEAYRQEALAKGFSTRAKDRYPNMDDLIRALFPEVSTDRADSEIIPPKPETRESIKIALPLLLAFVVFMGAMAYGVSVSQKKNEARTAEEVRLLMEEGRFEEAIDILESAKNFPDQESWILQCRYNLACSYLEQGQFQEADAAFEALGDYSDSEAKMLEARYALADQLYKTGNFSDSTAIFDDLRNRGYHDSQRRWQEAAYSLAGVFYHEGLYEEAAVLYDALGDYETSPFRLNTCRLNLARDLLEDPREKWDYFRALEIFRSLGDFASSREYAIQARALIAGKHTIAAGGTHTAAIGLDGTAVAVGDISHGKCNVTSWTDLISIAAGNDYTVALRADGTVVAAGSNFSGETNVAAWKDIIAISAGDMHTVGLCSDGTVVFTGLNSEGQGNVDSWSDIVAVSAGFDVTVGLCSDGTVVATGAGRWDEINTWRDIIAISAGNGHIVALRADGTVVAAGNNEDGQCDVFDWEDIVSISAGNLRTVAVKSDGTVVMAGSGDWGNMNVSRWQRIVDVASGFSHTIGLRSDGSLVCAGKNDRGQGHVEDLPEICLP